MAAFGMGIIVAALLGPLLGGWITDNPPEEQTAHGHPRDALTPGTGRRHGTNIGTRPRYC